MHNSLNKTNLILNISSLFGLLLDIGQKFSTKERHTEQLVLRSLTIQANNLRRESDLGRTICITINFV